MSPEEALERLLSLRQHQQDGKRSPHKPLLVLLALAALRDKDSSALAWEATRDRLAGLLAEFGPPSRTGAKQSAAYPFTRLRSDGVWLLDHEVSMDLVGPLDELNPTGRLAPDLEEALREPGLLERTARELVESQFPSTLIPDVLQAVGLELEIREHLVKVGRQRSATWRALIIDSWDRACAFCGYDGQLGVTPVGLEAAHVRWFNHDGPDEADNGLALCSLHHKLFDRGALGIDDQLRVKVSAAFSARTDRGRAVYELHERALRPRPGTVTPAERHVAWHDREVFKGEPLTVSG